MTAPCYCLLYVSITLCCVKVTNSNTQEPAVYIVLVYLLLIYLPRAVRQVCRKLACGESHAGCLTVAILLSACPMHMVAPPPTLIGAQRPPPPCMSSSCSVPHDSTVSLIPYVIYAMIYCLLMAYNPLVIYANAIYANTASMLTMLSACAPLCPRFLFLRLAPLWRSCTLALK